MESSVTEASDLTILGLSGKAHSGFITLLTYELITVEAGGPSRQKKKKKKILSLKIETSISMILTFSYSSPSYRAVDFNDLHKFIIF